MQQCEGLSDPLIAGVQTGGGTELLLRLPGATGTRVQHSKRVAVARVGRPELYESLEMGECQLGPPLLEI